ncbi:enoyl-CoA hydratase/isomerase family protein [Candidatus Aalborgicola defluviihabitans]|uniref:enoyl-CoA hydratase/isomerase family protein n=1 Tax=Candidatus Aalborgicola defluviihabitans TaxID=3386187 RepID=UPI001EBC08D8|nr:enoyl-CoA hydratase/isomerase family protein [Burkholderiales bacterium]
MSMSESPPVLSHPAKGVALIELNRPGAANRLQPDDLLQLLAMLDQLERQGDAKALVLAANGRHFSAGFDLRALLEGLQSDEPGALVDKALESVANRLDATPMITIVAVQGAVIGGATDLALACDLRLGTSDARMQMPAANFGLPLYAGALQRYVSRLGVDQAKRLVFLAETIDAAEMQRIGFLHEIVDDNSLRARALALAETVAAMPAKPLAAMKQVLNASALAQGTAAAQRDALAAAFDPVAVAVRVTALWQRRPKQAKPAGSWLHPLPATQLQTSHTRQKP